MTHTPPGGPNGAPSAPPPPPRPDPETHTGPPRWVWPLAVVIALIVGAGIGFAVGGAGNDDASDVQAENEALRSERDDLITERDQLQRELDDERDQTDRGDAEPGDEPDDEPGEQAPTEDQDEPARPDQDGDESDEAVGSRDNPFPVGTVVRLDDWEFEISEPREAAREVAAENEFNDPPAEGMEYYLVPVSATYVGDDTGNAYWDLDFAFVGDDNRTYAEYCGVIPDDLAEIADLYPEGTADGNVCIEVPAGADGLWTVTTWFSDPVFFTADTE